MCLTKCKFVFSEELDKCFEKGVLSQKIVNSLQYHCRELLSKYCSEWNTTAEQKDILNVSGLEEVIKRWQKAKDSKDPTAYLFALYNSGISMYIKDHKKLM